MTQDREAHPAIRELLAAYALTLDVGDIPGCVELFTADALFQVYGRSFVGHDSIRKMFEDAPKGLHHIGVSLIGIRDDTATARSQVLFVRAGDLHLRPALYEDELVREGERWRFRIRRCRFVTTHGLSDSPEGPR